MRESARHNAGMIQDWLAARRAGTEQSAAAIRVPSSRASSAARSRVPRPPLGWLSSFCKGMQPAETVALTQAMTDSGERMSWPGISGPFMDKHSTGGVGDKVSLVLAPLWAELGIRVPMLSGRGLGLNRRHARQAGVDRRAFAPICLPDRLHQILAEVGCFMNGQTESIAPADRILYALRDETCTVESIPLITASILSKKLVEGIEELVLDVKWGSGAFMKTRKRRRRPSPIHWWKSATAPG